MLSLNYHRVWVYYTNASSHDRTHKVQSWLQHSWISVWLGVFHHCPSSPWLAFRILPAFHRQARLVEHLQGQQTHSHLPLSWGRNSERIFRKCVKEKEYLMEDCSSSLLGCCRSRTPSWDLSKDVVPHVYLFCNQLLMSMPIQDIFRLLDRGWLVRLHWNYLQKYLH